MNRKDCDYITLLRYGTLRILQTGEGAKYISEVFRNTCKILKIKKIQSTAFHSKLKGSMARSHRVLAEYLKCYVNEDQTNCDKWVPFITYVYNTTVQSASGFTPFELLFGRPSTLTSTLKSSLKLNIITIIMLPN